MFTKKNISSTVLNWFEELLQYSFDVIHCPGMLHVLPDAIGRIFDNDPGKRQGDVMFGQVLEVSDWLSSPVDLVDMENLEVVSNQQVQSDLMSEAHRLGHFGATAMLRQIRSSGKTWSGIKDDCQKLVSSCIQCQRFNIGKHGFHPLTNLKALLPFDHICIDLKEMPKSLRGFTSYLLVVDICTRFAWIIPLLDKFGTTIAAELLKLFLTFGFPKIIGSDNGAEFVNEILAEVVKNSGIDHRLISAYHPRANGVVERLVGTTSLAIYKNLQGRDDEWDKFCGAVQFSYNLKISDITGSTLIL
jgi:hypothetical protein